MSNGINIQIKEYDIYVTKAESQFFTRANCLNEEHKGLNRFFAKWITDKNLTKSEDVLRTLLSNAVAEYEQSLK